MSVTWMVCEDKTECFDGNWGPKQFAALTAMHISDIDWVSAKEVMAEVVRHHGGDTKLLTSNHKFYVLNGLAKLGMIEVRKRPGYRKGIQYRITKRGRRCAICIINNKWI